MVSTQGEIRIGPSHQARLPEHRSGGVAVSDPELIKEREELRWLPAMALDGDLLMYLRAARSMAAFAGMVDGGSADDGCAAASRDDTTINALDVLHDSGYDPGKALQALVKCPVPKGIDKKWCEEETKRFVKGLRQFGKNFFRIRKDLLPHKDTPELVEFYYLWKKTPGANNNRPHRRRRQGSLRRIRNTRQTRGGTPHNNSPSTDNSGGASRPSPNPKEQGEGSSGSEEDNSEDDSDSRDQTIIRCQHCFSTSSRELAPCGAKERALVCADCRAHYAKTGTLPPRTDAPYLFRPVQTESPDTSPGRMRTRNKAKETPTKSGVRGKRSSGTSTPEPGGGGGVKSPSNSTCSNSPGERAKKRLCVDKIKTEGSGKARKRPMAEGEGEEESKRKRPDSPAESVTSDSASVADDTEAPEQDLVESLSEKPTDDTMLTVKDEENAAPTSPVSESSQLPVYKMDDCNVVFNVGVPKKEPLEQIVKEEPSLENCSPIQTSLQNTYGEQSPPPFEDDTKIMMQDVKPKVDDNFFSLSLSDRIMEPPGSGPLPKAFDEIPMPGKLSVKREGLFESVQNESVIVPMIQTSVESFVPKEEILDSPPTLQTVDQQTVTTQSQTVTLNNIKPECSEDSVSSEPTRPPSVSAPSLSPLPLTAYAPPSPRQPLSEPQNIDDKSSIIMPSFVPVDEKPTINIPSVPSALSASHHSGFSSFYHPHFHPHPGKINPSPPSYLSSGLQSEPQNLKIKQEVIPPESVQPSSDPLQSLKEVKVPGYSNSSCISQPLLPTSIAPSSTQDLSTTTQSSSPFQSVGPSVDNIKKEPESFHPIRTNTPSKSPSVKPLDTRPTPIVSPAGRTSSNHTPPFPPPLPPVSHSAANLIAPSPTVNSVSSLPQSVIHPSQQPSPLSRVSPGHLAHPHPFVPAMHPHHLIHHPLFAAAAAHAAAVHHSPYHPHHPYGGYPYPFPYGPYPIPQPVPPPSHPREPQKIETVMTSHHSSVTTRSLREETREESNSQHTIQEISTHHSSTSSHLSSSVHHHSGEKSISHSTSSSSSASVQHKINSSKRGTSPAATQASSSCHLSATLSQTTSSSLSSTSHQHSHQHHHQTATGERLSPSPHHLGNRPSGNKPHPHHPGLMVHPHHPMLAAPSSSLEALRAHAQAAAMQSPVPLPPSHGSGNMMGHPAFLSPDGTREVEIKPEPLVVSGDEGGGGEEEEVPSPTHPRPPSPEPKIEDSECHRSQSAIFLRHWNRGDYNSCARTDLTFKPVPDSKLARKREERIRKQAEKEREEREKVQARKIATPEKPETSKPPSRGPIESITSPYDRFNPRDMRSGYPDTPALRQLSEYARPHGGFSPVTLQRSAALGLPPQCIDPMLHYQLNSMNSMYGPSARDRLELDHMEREKRERELRELRERDLSDRIKDELMKNSAIGPRISNPLDPHWLELHRRYQGLGPGGLHQFSLYPGPGGPSQAAALSQLERERLERLGIPAPGQTGGAPNTAGPPQAPQPATSSLDADRLALTTDPMVRLQMAGISPEYHAHTHAHTHAHSHTHLHLHPGQQAGQNQTPTTPDPGSAFPLPASGSGGYPRPSLLPPREAALALHHPSDLLARPYADQLAHQAAAHEHLQRQILMERERFPHPSLMAHHEEYLRQQRERELKVRALEEAARGSRP